jgi:hypothetical protein
MDLGLENVLRKWSEPISHIANILQPLLTMHELVEEPW